ncbi:HIT family protein [Peribacillus sp. SCS-37]|uniref:HIT family protein n=1 Tax=Paraperibacillus esterisolvens TaxID=3115296 RepID=UPI0039063225
MNKRGVTEMDCFGCRLANGKEHIFSVYEDYWVNGFLDHDPWNEGHVLIMPKEHARYIEDMDEETQSALMQAASILSKAVKQLSRPDGISICQNGGTFDELTHFHMHIVPRYDGEDFASFYSESEWENHHLKNTLSLTQEKLKKIISRLKG